MRAGVYDAAGRDGLLGRLDRVQVREEGRVLLEVRLELTEPVLEPALAELVLDAVEAPVAHAFMIGTRPDGRNEPNGLTCRAGCPRTSEGLVACDRCAASS